MATLFAGEESSHQRMVKHLDQIRKRTGVENPWLGDASVKRLRKDLAAIPTGSFSAKRFRLHRELGLEELRLGNTEAAIEHLEAARGLTEEVFASPEEERGINFQLALAYLRLGENRNCVARHSTESCLVPIEGQGVHADAEGSRKATTLFEAILDANPKDLEALWLYNIAKMTLGEYPEGIPPERRVPTEQFETTVPFPRFRNVAPTLGLDTFNLSGGAVLEDFDNDGDLDLFTTTLDTRGPAHLYVQQEDGRFEDRTEAAGLSGFYGGLNAIQGDYDNDGWTDLVVFRGAWFGKNGRHPNSLLRNNGDGTFTDVTWDAGLAKKNYPTQTGAFADMDNDGDLDLFVGNEALPGGKAHPCQLFRNNGDGTFTDVAARAKVENYRFTKGCAWADVNGDGYQDLYVSNLGGENRLYRNNKDSTFTDIAKLAGVEKPERSFPVWFFDYDNDGILDLFVSSYWSNLQFVAASYLGRPHQAESLRVYRGLGNGRFQDVAEELGLSRIVNPMGANYGDLDNDGYPDFYLGTGYPDYDGLMPNVMLRNDQGKRFQDVTSTGGFGHLQKGHAVAFADIDNDGDQDVFEQLGGAFPGDQFTDVLFENPGFGNHWLTIKLIGVKSNRSAIGARVRVDVIEEGERRSIHALVGSGGSFGANPLRCEIGLGAAEEIARVVVEWPGSGVRQEVFGLAVDTFAEITEKH